MKLSPAPAARAAGIVAISCVAWCVARWLGASAFDAGLLAVGASAPFAVRRLPAARRRRLLTIELPVLVAACVGLAAAMASSTRVGDAALPWGSICVFAGYVLLWVVALRLLHAGALALAARLLRSDAAARSSAAVATLALGMPWLFVALQTHRVAVPERPAAAFSLQHARTVSFATEDGVTLRGTWLHHGRRDDARRPAAIVCHGLGANRAMFFDYADLLWTHGCDVLAFDFRAHGASGGFVTTLGADEVLDVRAAAAWVRSQPSRADAPIVLVGVSMGGATVLRAAADVAAAAVFAESSYADLGAMVDGRFAALGPFAGVAAWLVSLAAYCQLGVATDAISPRASLAALDGAVPVTLVHAGDDEVVPLAQGRALAAARRGGELHVIDGARHGGCSITGRARVDELLAELLARLPSR